MTFMGDSAYDACENFNIVESMGLFSRFVKDHPRFLVLLLLEEEQCSSREMRTGARNREEIFAKNPFLG